MKTIGLIIDDDDAIRETLEDRLDSMGFDFHSSGSQVEAAERLKKTKYDFILLDLELPNRLGKPTSIQVGRNLLDQIRADERNSETPVVVITAHGSDRPDLAVDLMKRGARDFINKPFVRLETSLRELLAPKPQTKITAQSASEAPTLKPFEGAELVFHADGADLCGITICTSGSTIFRILKTLCEQRSDGRRKAFTGHSLAEKISLARGQSAVAEAVSDFRKKAVLVLKQMGFAADDEAVIVRGLGGYELADHIRTAKRETAPQDDHSKISPEDRRAWFLQQLSKRKLKRSDYERNFEISEATSKRDLRAMENQIEFVGVGGKGYYRLKRTSAIGAH